jgi:DnaK suppressor protein
MQIDTEHYRNRLKQIEGDLLAEITRQENDARETASAEVEDAIDRANDDQQKDLALDESSRSYQTLVEVREALDRIEAGTFGKCEVCGRDIEPKRLEAIPWAKYCLQDAEAREPKFTDATL